MKPVLITLTIAISTSWVIADESPEAWYTQGKNNINSNAVIARKAAINSIKRAKNIILFVGDGMGISTVTGARIYAGQQLGEKGEEHLLSFEHFSHLALSKTYNTNQQTPDSSGTMTAIMSGVKTTAGEPSLSQMTAKAINILNNNKKGFFLHVEGGRIDHAHHATNPKRALEDTVEFSRAVQMAYEMTDPRETLIIVTADHSHVFTLAGYPTRGNPILGKVMGNNSAGDSTGELSVDSNGLPYTTVGYANGHGFHEIPGANSADAIYTVPINSQGRADLSDVDTEHEGFHSETLTPLNSETHGAEDAAIYATGPGASLVNRVMEQNALFHVMNKAARLEQRINHLNQRQNRETGHTDSQQ